VLRDALTAKNDDVALRVFYLLGRIVSFSAKTRNEELRKVVEPALLIFLQGLEETDPAVRHDVLSQLESIPIRRVEVIRALLRFLQKSDQTPDDRKTALAALAAQAAFADSDASLRATLGPAVPILTSALDAPEPEVRDSAAMALGYIGSAAGPAEDNLRNLAKNDPQPSVRKNAENAVKAIKGIAKMRPPSRRGLAGGAMAIMAQ
jgi:HEAT repeat protein